MGSRSSDGSNIPQNRKSTKSIGSAFVFNIDRREVETFLDSRLLPSGNVSISANQLHSVQMGNLVKTQTSVADTGIDRNFEGEQFSPIGHDLTFVEIRNDGGGGGTIIVNSGTTTIISSGTTIISGAMTVISGAVTNIYGGTTIISGSTTVINSNNTTVVSGTNIVNIGTTSSSGSVTFSTNNTDQWEITPEGNFESQVADNYILTSRRVLNWPEAATDPTLLDSRTVYTTLHNNPGDTITLPSGQKGVEFTFINGISGVFTVAGLSNNVIRVSSAVASGSAPKVSATGVGACITLLCINSANPTTWVATSMMGNWTTADS